MHSSVTKILITIILVKGKKKDKTQFFINTIFLRNHFQNFYSNLKLLKTIYLKCNRIIVYKIPHLLL